MFNNENTKTVLVKSFRRSLSNHELCVLACSCAWHALVPSCLSACVLSVRLLSMLACFIYLRVHMSYRLAVLKYLTCLRVCVTGIFACLIYFTFEKLNSENSYIQELRFYSDAYSETT